MHFLALEAIGMQMEKLTIKPQVFRFQGVDAAEE